MLDKVKAIAVIKELKIEHLLGKKTEYKDKTGKIIKIGDLVDYYFNAPIWSDDPDDGTYSDHDDSDEVDIFDSHTLMQDIVVEKDGEVYFFDADIWCGGYAWRHAEHCKIMGSIKRKDVI